jgi:hypothetical protein
VPPRAALFGASTGLDRRHLDVEDVPGLCEEVVDVGGRTTVQRQNIVVASTSLTTHILASTMKLPSPATSRVATVSGAIPEIAPPSFSMPDCVSGSRPNAPRSLMSLSFRTQTRGPVARPSRDEASTRGDQCICPGPPAAAGSSSSGFSTTALSAVRMIAAIEAAFCSAERVTFAGSRMPALNMSTHSPLAAS